MNIYSATINTLRQFAARHRRPRSVERKTLVFILVPLDFSKFGGLKTAAVAQDMIANTVGTEVERQEDVVNLATTDCSKIRAADANADEADANDEVELDHRLMWTWFLPNPLPPPKDHK